ncbi:hypothetical protein [Fibrella aquatilis]|uniref:Uncharacterized protein n=1 Tax=Fibrella aquatilis TaxID=2817059 RepID=A0A939G127_9BACT|nr:hypothetical protein [Fibrella aquatilis]MBO0930019.1 hypothetical protein [Fibrella aquatilis]
MFQGILNRLNRQIQLLESVLTSVRDLITDKGEASPEVQAYIDEALDELFTLYATRQDFLM